MSEIKAQFLSPRQARKQYDEIIPVYQAAFAVVRGQQMRHVPDGILPARARL